MGSGDLATCLVSRAVSMGRRNTASNFYLQGSQPLRVASVDSNGTLPCLVLIEHSRPDRSAWRKYCRIN
jgi:hypothetical protein